MWRPKDGFERRFEIQRKEDYEREEREKEREREGETYQGMFNATGRYVSVQNLLFTMYGQTDRSSKYLSNRCALAEKQDVVRGWTRGERAWSPW